MRILTLALTLLAGGCLRPETETRPEPAGAAPCAFGDADSAWLARAVGEWRRVGERALELEPLPLPPLVLFDTRCAYHVTADSSWKVTAVAHGGLVRLPNGRAIPPVGIGITSPATGDSTLFLALALPDAWRVDPRYRTSTETRADWEDYLVTAFSHEMTHARMLPTMLPRLREIEPAIYPDTMEDNLVQDRFRRVPAFARSVARETDLLQRALTARSAADRLAYLRAALAAMRARRAQYYVGDLAAWSDAEQVFLDLEGIAQWVSLHVSTRSVTLPRGDAFTLLLSRFRATREFWSEDQGLLMILVLDAMVPAWQERMLRRGGASAFQLLEEAAASPDR